MKSFQSLKNSMIQSHFKLFIVWGIHLKFFKIVEIYWWNAYRWESTLNYSIGIRFCKESRLFEYFPRYSIFFSFSRGFSLRFVFHFEQWVEKRKRERTNNGKGAEILLSAINSLFWNSIHQYRSKGSYECILRMTELSSDNQRRIRNMQSNYELL